MPSELPTTTTETPARTELQLLESPPPKRATVKWAVVIALGVIVAILGTGIGVYQWQHGRTTTADDAALITRLQAELTDRNRQITALYDRLLIHGQQIDRLTARIETLKARHQGASSELQKVQAQLAKARAGLASAQSELNTWVGPPLPDGVYMGVLYAADDADDPFRIAMYVVNDVNGNVLVDRGWRVLEVTPDIVVRLTTPPGGPSTKAFGAFSEMWNHGETTFAYLHAMIFNITVSNDRVSELVETGEPNWGS
jgi:hypothetical protein